MTLHAFWRAFVLVVLGIALRSIGHTQTYFTFEDTLSQIGLGYGVLFMLGFRPVRDQWIALGTVLLGYWLAFALYPLPGPAFDYPRVGVPADWPHLMSGFAAHWNKNSNLAWAFDTWFLNLFPREKPFEFNGGGYATLSFIPTLGTMILGLVAGGVLRRDLSPRRASARLPHRGRGPARRRVSPRLGRRLPGRQAHLDAELHAMERRLVLPAARGASTE